MTGRARLALWAVTLVVACLVLAPCVYLVLWSAWGTEVIGVLRDPSDPTAEWYYRVFLTAPWQTSIFYSLALAGAVAAIGTGILLLYSYFIRFAGRQIDTLSFAAVVLVLLTPAVAYAMALRLTGSRLGFPEWLLLLMGHLIVALPLQFIVFEASREHLHSDALFAGSTMGAPHLRNLAHVYVPNMTSPILYSYIVGFFISFDEVVVAIFVIQGAMVTVPRRLWDNVSQLATPEPAVIAVFLLAIFLALSLTARHVGRLRRVPRRR